MNSRSRLTLVIASPELVVYRNSSPIRTAGEGVRFEAASFMVV